MGTDFWGGFWLGCIIVAMLWGFTSRSKPREPEYRWSDKNWHPDYVEPRKAPRVLKKMGKK